MDRTTGEVQGIDGPVLRTQPLGRSFACGDGYCASVERGAGSGERGFLNLISKFFDNHGEGDLLPWIMKLWAL
jgi:hypothetical protein